MTHFTLPPESLFPCVLAHPPLVGTIRPMNRKSAALLRLEQIIGILRSPGGCPWDRAQTLGTMSRYLLEESCEVIDAVEDAGGRASPDVCEELGDVLVNVLLASRIAEDEGTFTITDVAATASQKLVRRHPHVFAEANVSGVDEVLKNWNAIKRTEKARNGASTGPQSRLDGVPRSLPALEQAAEVGRKAARVGFDWPDASGALEKVGEELEEVRAKLANGSPDALREELGDLLFAVVNVCRKLEVRPEEALRGAIRKFSRRFRRIEEKIPEPEKARLDELEAVWQEAKREEAP